MGAPQCGQQAAWLDTSLLHSLQLINGIPSPFICLAQRNYFIASLSKSTIWVSSEQRGSNFMYNQLKYEMWQILKN